MSAIPVDSNATPQRPMGTPQLRTLVVCDLVESTALIEELGDKNSAEILRRHDRFSRDLLYRFGGREIDKTDGFLLLFDRPIQAVAFALEYQRQLRQLGDTEFLPLLARIGIHVGDVVLWNNDPADIAQGAKPVEVEGLVKPIAARLMSLALPGQILMSGIAYSLAQRAQSELDPEHSLPQWKPHGRYRFKGVADPVSVFEVGETNVAPLRAPPYSGKAYREIPWWRRPGVLAAEAAVLIVAIAVPLYFSLRSPSAIAFAERDWIVTANLRNLTGQSVLDDSLDAAFRISLEQSRYVNLIPELQVRDTLKRMDKPVDSKIDRVIGSEIALREGARALILPSIAEIGGRVRVTAEVIDPHTQATVYVESADGIGMESVLPSVGKVSSDLRGRLGEALASVEANGAPLPTVTTSNLDALRAYALAVRTYSDGRWSDAMALLDQAIKLDPNFALAYMGKASVHLSANDNMSARKDLQHAENLRGHLPPRDALRLDALIAMFGKPAVALEKWKLLGSLYPDAYVARYCYALIAWSELNEYESAISELNKALSDHNQALGATYYLLGTLQLATEHHEEALASLKQAQALKHGGLGLVIVDAYAIRRQFDDANKAISNSALTGVASNDVQKNRTSITLPLDQGHWTEALHAAEAGVSAATATGPLYGRQFRATELSLLVLSPPTDYDKQLRGFFDSETNVMQREDDLDRPRTLFNILLTAYLAARVGDTDLAITALSIAKDHATQSGYPNLMNMLAIVEAEIALAQRKPENAILGLKFEMRGTELYLTHIALRDAYAAAGKNADALKESGWLANHRGRAYEEQNSEQILQPLNIAESDLALLSQAELSEKSGDRNHSSKFLNDFLAVWPDAKQISFVSKRIDTLTKH